MSLVELSDSGVSENVSGLQHIFMIALERERGFRGSI